MPASPDEPKPRRTCGDWCRFRAAGLGSNARPTCGRPRRRARSADGEPPVHLFGTFARPRHPGAAPVHLFASFVRPRHEARGSRAPCRGPHARRRRSLPDGKGLRPAETRSSLPWSQRGAPSRTAATEGSTAADRCPRRAKVPKKCTAPTWAVANPQGRVGGAPRALPRSAERRPPAARRPSAPRAKQTPRPRAASCAENRPKCICGPEAERRCAEKRAECIFRQEPPDAQSTLEGRECFPVFSETAGQTGAIAFLARRGARCGPERRCGGAGIGLPDNTLWPIFSTSTPFAPPENTLCSIFSTSSAGGAGSVVFHLSQNGISDHLPPGRPESIAHPGAGGTA